jgi:hypothetical protein
MINKLPSTDSIEEMLRKTGEFKEKDIEESAKFVKDFVNVAMDITDALPSYEQLNKALGIRRTK